MLTEKAKDIYSVETLILAQAKALILAHHCTHIIHVYIHTQVRLIGNIKTSNMSNTKSKTVCSQIPFSL